MSPARPLRSASTARLGAGVVLGLVLASGGCASAQRSAQHTGHQSTQSVRALAAEYMAIARPANHRLDVAVEAFADHAHHDLAAAEAALRLEAATERRFDRQLAAITFPPAIASTASALIRVNEIRARLTEKQARARSIPALLAFADDHKMADAQVEAQVRAIRAQLGLPPPETS
jgi:hypothetical protein